MTLQDRVAAGIYPRSRSSLVGRPQSRPQSPGADRWRAFKGQARGAAERGAVAWQPGLEEPFPHHTTVKRGKLRSVGDRQALPAHLANLSTPHTAAVGPRPPRHGFGDRDSVEVRTFRFGAIASLAPAPHRRRLAQRKYQRLKERALAHGTTITADRRAVHRPKSSPTVGTTAAGCGGA